MLSKKEAIQKWQKLSVTDISETPKILELSKEIQKTGVKNTDSLHLACAICFDCDYFITVDARILKYSNRKIIICDPLEFLITWEEFL